MPARKHTQENPTSKDNKNRQKQKQKQKQIKNKKQAETRNYKTFFLFFFFFFFLLVIRTENSLKQKCVGSEKKDEKAKMCVCPVGMAALAGGGTVGGHKR
jgi:hypothetical protein